MATIRNFRLFFSHVDDDTLHHSSLCVGIINVTPEKIDRLADAIPRITGLKEVNLNSYVEINQNGTFQFGIYQIRFRYMKKGEAQDITRETSLQVPEISLIQLKKNLLALQIETNFNDVEIVSLARLA